MPTPTDNHNLDVGYVEGESWDYNDEFQTIEERLVVRDTEANLSNYTPHSAATFIATDTGAVYDGDGTNWNAATRSYNEASVGSSPVQRPIISNGDATIYVDPVGGSDSAEGTQTDPVATIQEAVDRCPFYLRHKYTVDLTTAPSLPVTYDEDVLIDSVLGTGQATSNGGTEAGPTANLVLAGDQTTPSNVEVGSVTVGSCVGTGHPRIQGVHILREGPYYENLNGISFYGSGEGQVWDVEFDSATAFTRGVLAYASTVETRRVDVSNCDRGIVAKRNAQIQAQDTTGTANTVVYSSTATSRISFLSNSATATDTVETNRASTIYDIDSQRLYRDGQRARNWYLLFSSEDTNGSSVFDIDTGSLGAGVTAMAVDLYLETPSSVSGTVNLRVNGDSTADYLYTDLSGTTSSGQTEVQLGGLGGNEASYGQLLISGNEGITSGDKKAAISNNLALGAGSAVTQKAKSPALTGSLDQIRIWSTMNCVGRMDIYGYSFGE